MRFKVLIIFLGFQLVAFGLYRGVLAFVPSFDETVVTKTDQILKPASFRLVAEGSTSEIPRITSEAIYKTLAHLPAGHTKTLQKIVLKYDPEAARGMGGARTILLRSIGISANELSAVLIHEIGHSVDLGYLNTADARPSEFKDGGLPIYEGDPSLDFYRVSWDSEKQIKTTANNFDFVSGYAMTDPFEDFAESYAFYVLHNDEFRFLASNNDVLFKKYNFLKNTVFAGQEYRAQTKEEYNPFRRVWDVTMMKYDL